MSYTSLHYHIVFSTKDRVSQLNQDMMSELRKYTAGIVRNHEGRLLHLNGPEDHVHLLAQLTPKTALMDVIRHVKGNTSKWLSQTFAELKNFFWQEGYSAFTISQSGLSKVMVYIDNQVKHHHKMTFQEELIVLLEKHQIEYDERYVFA